MNNWRKFLGSSAVVVVLATTVALGTACGGQSGQAASVKEGTLPAGATFQGVWFNPTWGELHMVPNGNAIFARWRSDAHGVWGEMQGAISNDVIHFTWEEHKTGAVGPGSVRKGKGYFKYVPVEAPDMPRLKGEWGLEPNEVGGGEWDCVLQKDVPPRPDKIGGDPDPTIDSGWDKPIRK